MKNLILKSTYNILGSVAIGNGLWMIISASGWFANMPIAAQDTGPLNEHFVHDIGLVYLLVGIGAFWCGHKYNCIEVHIGITLFMAGHDVRNTSRPPTNESLAYRFPFSYTPINNTYWTNTYNTKT